MFRFSTRTFYRGVPDFGQRWYRYWLGGGRQQAITWTNAGKGLWCHMALTRPWGVNQFVKLLVFFVVVFFFFFWGGGACIQTRQTLVWVFHVSLGIVQEFLCTIHLKIYAWFVLVGCCYMINFTHILHNHSTNTRQQHEAKQNLMHML